MPVQLVPNSAGAARQGWDVWLQEFNQCHNPSGAGGGRFCSGDMAGGTPWEKAKQLDKRLKSPEEVARRSNPEMTAEEAANPAFQKNLQAVRTFLETGEYTLGNKTLKGAPTDAERANPVGLARAYYESEQGWEGYNFPGSLLKHKGDGPGGLTPERAALHRQIVEHFMEKFTAAERNPTVVVTGGLPGAGKSVGLDSVEAYKDFFTINADDIKAMLPEYNGTNAGFVHEESDLIASAIFEQAVKYRQNIILDVTMKSLGDANKGIKDGLYGRLTAMAGRGYEVQLQFTEVSMDTSVQEAVSRHFRQGRFVPPVYIRGATSKKGTSSQNYDTFVELQQVVPVRGAQHYRRKYYPLKDGKFDTRGAPKLYRQSGRPTKPGVTDEDAKI